MFFWDGLVKEIGIDKPKLWPEKLNLIGKEYHGQIFYGNAWRKLLNNANEILELNAYEAILRNYYNAFTAYNNLVANLFSSSKVCMSNEKTFEHSSGKLSPPIDYYNSESSCCI